MRFRSFSTRPCPNNTQPVTISLYVQPVVFSVFWSGTTLSVEGTATERVLPWPTHCERDISNLQLAARGSVGHIGPCRRRGRVAEGGGLLNRYRVVKPYRGFESLRLRQKLLFFNILLAETHVPSTSPPIQSRFVRPVRPNISVRLRPIAKASLGRPRAQSQSTEEILHRAGRVRSPRPTSLPVETSATPLFSFCRGPNSRAAPVHVSAPFP